MSEHTLTVNNWLRGLLATFRLAWAEQLAGSYYGLSNLEDFSAPCQVYLFWFSPNPPKDTDGRREDSGRGWVRELQGRWPGVLG